MPPSIDYSRIRLSAASPPARSLLAEPTTMLHRSALTQDTVDRPQGFPCLNLCIYSIERDRDTVASTPVYPLRPLPCGHFVRQTLEAVLQGDAFGVVQVFGITQEVLHDLQGFFRFPGVVFVELGELFDGKDVAGV